MLSITVLSQLFGQTRDNLKIDNSMTNTYNKDDSLMLTHHVKIISRNLLDDMAMCCFVFAPNCKFLAKRYFLPEINSRFLTTQRLRCHVKIKQQLSLLYVALMIYIERATVRVVSILNDLMNVWIIKYLLYLSFKEGLTFQQN